MSFSTTTPSDIPNGNTAAVIMGIFQLDVHDSRRRDADHRAHQFQRDDLWQYVVVFAERGPDQLGYRAFRSIL